MPISDTKKLDLLWKKVGFGVTETDPLNKNGTNEVIPSNILVLNESIWADSASLTVDPPTDTNAYVQVCLGLFGVTLIRDETTVGYRAWIAEDTSGQRLGDWIPPSIGPDYAIRVYLGGTSSTGGILINPTVNNNEWVFDYQAGVLFFPSCVPLNLQGTQSLWVEGYRYIGAKGGTGGGGGTGVYTNVNPTPITVGGISAGSTFNNQTMQNMFDTLLYPYQYPTFTAFSMSGQANPLEVGDTLTGDRTFAWQTSHASNIVPDTIIINDVTGSAVLGSNLPNNGSFKVLALGPLTFSTPTTYTWHIQATNTKNATFSTNYSVYWYTRRYFGESTLPTLDADAITSLRVSSLVTGFSSTYAYTTGGYKYLCYPSSFGLASSFTDKSTNLNVPFEEPYVVTVTNDFGIEIEYNVHRTVNVLGGSINIIIN